MDLKDFIHQTLVNIVEGVDAANTEVDRFKLASHGHDEHGFGQDIEFDIPVTVSQNSKGHLGGEGKILMATMAVAQLKGDLSRSKKNEDIHRIKFKVFVADEPKTGSTNSQ